MNNEEREMWEEFEQYKRLRLLCDRCQISFRKPDGQLKTVQELFEDLNDYYLKNCQEIDGNDMKE